MSTDAIVRHGTPPTLGDGTQQAPVLDKLGYLRTTPFFLRSVLEGRAFHAQVGSESTGIAFSTTYDEDQPEAVITVPDGTTILPVYVVIALETMAGTITSVIVGGSENNIGAGTSTTPMTLGIDNMLLGSSKTSACVSYQAYSGNSSALTNKREFWRKSMPFVDAAGVLDRNQVWAPYSEYSIGPVLKGPASLIVWTEATGTAPNGYIQVAWVEYTTSELGI